MTIAAGLGYRVGGGLNLGADIKQDVYNQQTSLSFGTEYMVSNIMMLRGGSLLSAGNYLESGVDLGLTGGFGISVMGNNLDYALSMVGDLGPAHKVSFSAKF